MAVKHNPTSVVNSETKGSKTGCGVNTNESPSHWLDSHQKITCERNGCKK